jgi:hypothetical protein
MRRRLESAPTREPWGTMRFLSLALLVALAVGAGGGRADEQPKQPTLKTESFANHRTPDNRGIQDTHGDGCIERFFSAIWDFTCNCRLKSENGAEAQPSVRWTMFARWSKRSRDRAGGAVPFAGEFPMPLARTCKRRRLFLGHRQQAAPIYRPGLELLEPREVPSAVTTGQIRDQYGQVPLSFEANEGQTDPHVQFLAHGPGYALFLSPNEAVFSLRRPEDPAASGSPSVHSWRAALARPPRGVCRRGSAEQAGRS